MSRTIVGCSTHRQHCQARTFHMHGFRCDGKTISTLDLIGKGRFTILTGVDGEVWEDAVKMLSQRYQVEIASAAIEPGCEVEDLYFEWSRQRFTDENGCLLIRPDGTICWRSMSKLVEAQSA